MCEYEYIYKCNCIYIYIHVCKYVNMYIYIYVCIYIYVYAHINICKYILILGFFFDSSLTGKKASWGRYPLLTTIYGEVTWGRYNFCYISSPKNCVDFKGISKTCILNLFFTYIYIHIYIYVYIHARF